LVLALVESGIRHVEAVSFVSPKAVPSMARPDEVLAEVGHPEGATITALVPNLKGAQLALDADVDEITVTVAASATYNERNVKMSIEESVESIAAICELAAASGTPVDAVLSCAFGSPYEGDLPAADVADLVGTLRDGGASAITLADTTGMATPRVLSEVLSATGIEVGLHMHETRGTGLLNCYTAMQMGIVRFDSSVGGLGGSPFAAGAAGNVATEDLVALLDDLGVRTGISLERLLRASAVIEELVGHPLASRVAYAGGRLADHDARDTRSSGGAEAGQTLGSRDRADFIGDVTAR
jgi:hydroxymethylglutaryl-CoA lyase